MIAADYPLLYFFTNISGVGQLASNQFNSFIFFFMIAVFITRDMTVLTIFLLVWLNFKKRKQRRVVLLLVGVVNSFFLIRSQSIESIIKQVKDLRGVIEKSNLLVLMLQQVPFEPVLIL
jgi:hypothetical protein